MRISIVVIALFLISDLSAQVIDDSTKVVYGFNTISFTTEYNLLNNIDNYHIIDTSIYLYERQSYVNSSGRKFQNLGNLGTALFPIYHPTRPLIGRTSGLDAYAKYAIEPSEIKYYDTKSPFIKAFLFAGGGNRNLIDISFSRNINASWNIGFDLKLTTVNKQLAPQNQTDRQVIGTSFAAYTHYKHPKIPYQFLFNYSSMNHNVFELGGARPSLDSLELDFFLFDNVLLRLDEAQNRIKITNWHFYHSFQPKDQFQVYHIFNYRKEIASYQDAAGAIGVGNYDLYRDFYNDFLLDEDATNEEYIFTTTSNEVGLKGNLSSLFYRFYARLKTIDWKYLLYDPEEKTVETYLGALVRFKWKEKFTITGNIEYLLGGEFQLEGNLSSDLLTVNYTAKRVNVPFIFSDYFGNHHEWHNDFDPIFSNELSGQINLNFKLIEIKPKAKFTTYTNFIYFDEEINPTQSNKGLLLSSFGGDINVRILNGKGEGWHFEHEAYYTNVSGGASNAVRVPQLFVNARYFWRGKWFKDFIPVEIGIDGHARTAYFANAYAPEIQQFYLQNTQEAFGYVATDLFLNMQIDKFFLSLKWTHFNQSQNGGYIVTPNYPGQPRVFDIIIKWLFFD